MNFRVCKLAEDMLIDTLISDQFSYMTFPLIGVGSEKFMPLTVAKAFLDEIRKKKAMARQTI